MNVCDMLYAVLYVLVNCFVVRGCAVSRRYINVCNSNVFSVVDMYLDHSKFRVVCIIGRRYECCSECNVVSNEYDKPTHPRNVNSKLAFHKEASFHQHYLTFTLQTYHHLEHLFSSWSTQMISPLHLYTQAAEKYIQPYLHKVFVWTKQNNLTLNPDKTICTLFTTVTAEYKRNMDLKINNMHYPWALP